MVIRHRQTSKLLNRVCFILQYNAEHVTLIERNTLARIQRRGASLPRTRTPQFVSVFSA
jgi:hypothetical protein